MSESTSRTELSALGEFGLIERIASRVRLANPSSVKGIGDDAAVLDPQGLHQVVTTDMLVEGVHFDLGYVPLKHLGYKAIVVNLSDVYAMNAEPRQVTVALALSNRFPVEAIDELYEGMLLACKNYGVDLVGGDTCSSTSGLVISITAIGAAKKEDITYRNHVVRWIDEGHLGRVVATSETTDVRQHGDSAIRAHLEPKIRGAA
ncbi:MAG TPA: thiamine-phosphate kinase, partial [Flavobacteriales bacterium]|nr:thiamine-phosphate kinase [Flavobacteriales bacterium]